MEKKGFTLIEVLAVVAILAVLIIIVIPNILQIYRDTRKNSFVTELKEIYKTAKQQWVSNALKEPREESYARCSECSIRKLDLQGRQSIDYYIKLNDKGEVIYYCATDSNHQYLFEDGILSETEITDASLIGDLSRSELIEVTDSGCELIYQ